MVLTAFKGGCGLESKIVYNLDFRPEPNPNPFDHSEDIRLGLKEIEGLGG